ncbi:MAG: hypothetical protein FJ102_22390 [Deltaproteobacteria bacterium]|nr:hypothetical protein [Deltaproteobacteria bacterium]
MALDPYGYPEAPPVPGVASAGAGDTEAIAAMWAAVGSLTLNALAICSCYMTGLLALPLGIYALYKSSMVNRAGLSASGSASATAGLVGGAVGTLLGMFFAGMALFMLAYFLFLFVMIFLGAIGAAAGA